MSRLVTETGTRNKILVSDYIGNRTARPLRSLVGNVRKLAKARMLRMARQAKGHYHEAPFARRRMALIWVEASEDAEPIKVFNETSVRSP